VTSEAGLSIVVVDEQPLVLQALASRLEARGFVVQAALRTAAEVLEFLRDQTIDVVVLGLPLRGEGAACLRAIRSTAPDLPVVVCNAPGEGEPDMAFAEGAAAFVAKSGHPDDVVAAVRQTVSRSIFLSPEAIRRAAQTMGHVSLTPRELEIVRVAAEGGTNAEIARRLWVTEQTIKFHLSNIYRKLGVSNRTEMSRYAQLHGLLTDEPREVTKARSARQARKRSAQCWLVIAVGEISAQPVPSGDGLMSWVLALARSAMPSFG
jgi:DNA-binding NarL/FixJ family response regulator